MPADTPTIATWAAHRGSARRMDSARQAVIARGGWARAQLDLKVVVRDAGGQCRCPQPALAYTFRKQEKPDLAEAFGRHYQTGRYKLNALSTKGLTSHIGEAYLMDRKPRAGRAASGEFGKNLRPTVSARNTKTLPRPWPLTAKPTPVSGRLKARSGAWVDRRPGASGRAASSS